MAAAVLDGEISAAHAGVIAGCVDAIPAEIAAEAAPIAERMLVEAARHEHPGQLAKTAALLLARLDPDGIEPRERDNERRRAFGLRKNADGSSTPSGHLIAELTATLETIFDSLAAPVPAEQGLPDDRSPGQRRHDALTDALQRVLRSGTLPAAGGSPVTILARTTVRELTTGLGIATTGTGVQLSIAELMRMAGEAETYRSC